MLKCYNWLRRNLKNLLVTVAGCYLILLVLDRQKSVPAVISREQGVTNKEKEEVTESLANRIENLIDIKSKLSSISDHDPQLLDYIQRKLVPPAPPNTKLILAKEIHSGQIGQAEEVIQYFNGKRNGVFVEAGAWDGEYLSNTLFLETKYNWTGLLVEPNSGAYQQLVGRHRRAHCVHSCLAVTPHPDIVTFDSADVFGGINVKLDNVDNKHLENMRDSIPKAMRRQESVECYPLYSLLLATHQPRVDFLSLDIEGAELAVLRTVPWDKVDIELVMLEVNHSDRAELEAVMTGAGYTVHKALGRGQDIIYRRVRH